MHECILMFLAMKSFSVRDKLQNVVYICTLRRLLVSFTLYRGLVQNLFLRFMLKLKWDWKSCLYLLNSDYELLMYERLSLIENGICFRREGGWFYSLWMYKGVSFGSLCEINLSESRSNVTLKKSTLKRLVLIVTSSPLSLKK